MTRNIENLRFIDLFVTVSSAGAKEIGITSALTSVIEKGSKLVGPLESSKNNSREYRCKFYVNKWTWNQYFH